MNNFYILILCIFSKIGFAPFIIILASIWFSSNYIFLFIDLIIKFGYFICFIVILYMLYFYIYIYMLYIYYILSFIYVLYFIKLIYSIKQIIFISSLVNYINSTICALVSNCFYSIFYYIILSVLLSIILLVAISLLI